MPLETATYIAELVPTNPLGSDPKAQGDDHLRLVKSVMQSQFPNFEAAAVTLTVAQLNELLTRNGWTDLTPVAASGANVDFAIPAGVTDIMMTLSGVSMAGSQTVIGRFGTGSTVETVYNSSGAVVANNVSAIARNETAGVRLGHSAIASSELSGIWRMKLLDPTTNLWCWMANTFDAIDENGVSAAGSLALAGALDIMQLWGSGGTFDAGFVNVSYGNIGLTP